MSVHIRKARPTDWEACANLDHSIVTDRAWRIEERDLEGAITVTFRPVNLPREIRVAYPRRDQDLPAGWERADLFLVAYMGSEVWGYVTARALPGHGMVWLQDLVVDAGWRRRGIGAELLHKTALWARERDLGRLVIEVQTRNDPGICFCRARGLALCGYDDHHWRTRDIALLFGQTLR